MDASFLSPVSNPVAVPAASPSPAAAQAQGVSGADFANLLSQMMASAQRQGLAGGASASLQAVALSPNIEVITADAPLPDNDSLLAFARSQGLDEGMIGALFVSATTAGEPVAGSAGAGAAAALAQAVASQGMNPGQGALTLPAASSTAGGPDGLQAQPGQADPATLTLASPPDLQAALGQLPGPVGVPLAMPSSASPTAPLPSAAGPLPATLSVLASPLAASAIASQAGSAVRIQPPGPDLSAPADAGGKSDAPTVASVAALGGAAMRRLDLQWSTAGTAAVTPTDASVQVQAMASAPPALQNALRIRLQPQEAVTRRLADLAASGGQAIWADLSAPAAGEPDLLRLDLGELPVQAVDDMASHADSLPTPQAGQLATARHLTQAALPTAAQDPGALTDRAAQYEQLAQRLGEALGQRLQAQIESGQWKVQMQVDPASLGRIDMELDMRAGGLDAVFRSDNALTRELITQGLPRLRESLAQSGTAVASVWVQGDSGRQSGGNSTPGRWQAPGRGSAGKEDEVSAEPSAVRTRTTSNSAWDLLA